jgi:hypothetical protein
MVTQKFNFRGNRHNATAPGSTKDLPISNSLDTKTRSVNAFKFSFTEFMHYISKEQKHGYTEVLQHWIDDKGLARKSQTN